MSGDLSGFVNVISVLSPTSPVGALRTSDYVSMENCNKVIFIASAGPGQVAGCTGQVETSVLGAYTATGGGAQALGIYTTMNASGTTGMVTRASAVAVIGASSFITGGTLVVNGITYTFSTLAAYTTATFSTARIVGITVAPSVDPDVALEHLAAYINHVVYGVPGLIAHFNSTHVAVTTSSDHHLYITRKGDAVITLTAGSSSQLTPIRFDTISEVTSADLLAAGSSQKYVAITLTPTSLATLSAIAIKSMGRYQQGNTGNVGDYAVYTT